MWTIIISLAVIGAVDKYSDGKSIKGNSENNKNYYREGSIITLTVTSLQSIIIFLYFGIFLYIS